MADTDSSSPSHSPLTCPAGAAVDTSLSKFDAVWSTSLNWNTTDRPVGTALDRFTTGGSFTHNAWLTRDLLPAKPVQALRHVHNERVFGMLEKSKDELARVSGEQVDAVAQRRGGQRQHPPELARAEDADGRTRRNHSVRRNSCDGARDLCA